MSVRADHETSAEGTARALSFAGLGGRRRDVRRGRGERLRRSSLNDGRDAGSWIRHAGDRRGVHRGGDHSRVSGLGTSSSARSLSVSMIGAPLGRPSVLVPGPPSNLATGLETARLTRELLPSVAPAADEEHDAADATPCLPGGLESGSQRLASATWVDFWTAKMPSTMVCPLEHVTGGLELDTPGPAPSLLPTRRGEPPRETRPGDRNDADPRRR